MCGIGTAVSTVEAGHTVVGLTRTPAKENLISPKRRRNGVSAATPSAPMPGGVPDPQRRHRLRRSRTDRCPRHGTTCRRDDRTHPQRSQRGAHRRLRDRLRYPHSHPRPRGPRGLRQGVVGAWRVCRCRTVDPSALPMTTQPTCDLFGKSSAFDPNPGHRLSSAIKKSELILGRAKRYEGLHPPKD